MCRILFSSKAGLQDLISSLATISFRPSKHSICFPNCQMIDQKNKHQFQDTHTHTHRDIHVMQTSSKINSRKNWPWSETINARAVRICTPCSNCWLETQWAGSCVGVLTDTRPNDAMLPCILSPPPLLADVVKVSNASITSIKRSASNTPVRP